MTPTQGWTSIIVWAIIVALISGSGISLMFFRPTPTTHRETEYISCSRLIRNGFQDKTARSVMLSFSRATNTSPSLPVSYQTHPRPLRNGMLKPLTYTLLFFQLNQGKTGIQERMMRQLNCGHQPSLTSYQYQNTQNTGVVGSSRLRELPPEASSDERLQELLRGDMRRYDNYHHRADWHLLMKLLHWTGDDKQLGKSIFLNSPLGSRDKAADPDRVGRRGNTNYVDRTIDRIIEKRHNPPMKR